MCNLIQRLVLISIFFYCQTLYAHNQYPLEDRPILVIGASYASGKVPFNEGLTSPLSGTAVNLGNYLSLGDGLIRSGLFVINEGQAGATTFQRLGCNPGPACGPGYWDSYQTQLERALLRVTLPDGSYNADYLLIDMPNDCLHSDAFGVPQNQTVSCSIEQVNEIMDALIAVGNYALQFGITPVYIPYPRYQDLDLPLTQQLFGFDWIVTEAEYNYIRMAHKARIETELPQALYAEGIWRGFQHIGDGLHPTPKTIRKAVWRLLSSH